MATFATLDDLKALAKQPYEFTLPNGVAVVKLRHLTHGEVKAMREDLVSKDEQGNITDFTQWRERHVLLGVANPSLTAESINDLDEDTINALYTRIGQDCGTVARPIEANPTPAT